MKYRVRRDLPHDSYVQLKSSTLPECKAFLEKMQQTWANLGDMGTFGGREPFVASISGKVLTVTQGEKVVDRYVIEPVKA